MRDWIYRIVFAPAVVISASATSGYATQYLSVEEAQKACFGEAVSFNPATVQLTADQMKAIEDDSGVRVRLDSQQVWRVMQGEKFEGWFIVDEVLGKHEFINWALALLPDGSVKHIEILDYRETYGSEIREANWLNQFNGKMHGAELKLDNDIVNISGATLSSKHITDGVKRLLSFYEIVLKH